MHAQAMEACIGPLSCQHLVQLLSPAAPTVKVARYRKDCSTRHVVCQAGKGKAYFEKYKANRERHAGVLLPPPESSPGVPQINLHELEHYLQQELWAYTFGDPSPHEDTRRMPVASTAQAPALGEVSIPGAQQGAGQQLAPAAQASSKGTVIPPPVLTLRVSQARPPPPLPVKYDRSLAQVHVFWDVASKHPGALDPRVVATRLSRLAARYGTLAGLYAYAVRKDWNWVPEHFMQFRDEAGGAAGDEDARHRCPVCGVGRRTLVELDAHMRAVHPAAVAIGRAAEGAARAAIGSGGALAGAAGAGGTGGAAAGAVTGAARAVGLGGAAAGAAGSLAGLGGAPGAALLTRNTSRRTLGKVSEYHTAGGKVVVPPSGKQLSLKYCLTQEGWEARIVQNAAEAESVAIASGMGRLLDRVRRGETGGGPGEKVVVVAVTEDEERLQQPLLRLRGVGGVATVVVRQGEALTLGRGGGGRGGGGAVGMGGGSFRGADLVVSWEDVLSGAFEGT